jgi:small basic protein
MEFPINFEMWQGIIGILLPLVVAFMKNQVWEKWIKLSVMFALALGVSVIEVIISGAFTMGDLIGNFLKIAFLATTAYAWLWNTIGVDKFVATNFGIGKTPK